jgi:cAMP-dependent protein kinase regulator
MGTQNSKEGEKEGFQSPFSGLGAALSVALPKNMNMPLPHLRKLNPAVALQTLMKPSQYAVKKGAHHLRNIFAVPLDWTDYKPPVHPKSVSEEEFILEALKQNFVFSCVVQETLSPLMLAFEKYKASAGDTLIRQGDQGDYFYVLYAGKCNFQVDGKAVGEAGPGDSFGELALLYTCPRAATVQALTDVTVFRVDQKSFRYLLRYQTEHSENIKLDLLAKVPFLADLRPTDLQKLADAMTPRSFPVGTALLRQGEPVKSFFVLERGRIAVTNVTIGGADYADQMLEPGSYGGEQIILRNAERQCNATAETDVLFFLIDKATFETVMGSHAELVMRSADKKNLVR